MNKLYLKIPFINNICYIISTHILREIVRNDNTKQQSIVFKTLEFFERLRDMRT